MCCFISSNIASYSNTDPQWRGNHTVSMATHFLNWSKLNKMKWIYYIPCAYVPSGERTLGESPFTHSNDISVHATMAKTILANVLILKSENFKLANNLFTKNWNIISNFIFTRTVSGAWCCYQTARINLPSNDRKHSKPMYPTYPAHRLYVCNEKLPLNSASDFGSVNGIRVPNMHMLVQLQWTSKTHTYCPSWWL